MYFVSRWQTAKKALSLLAIGVLSFACLSPAKGQTETSRVTALLKNAEFQDVSPEELEGSKNTLSASLTSVSRSQELSDDDKAFLQLRATSELLKSNSIKLEASLVTLAQRLRVDLPPSNQTLKLRDETRKHLQLVRNIAQRTENKAAFTGVKLRLLDALKAYAQTRSPSNFDDVASGVLWCEQRGVASEFVQAAKQDLAYPNIELRIPAAALRIVTEQEFDRTEPVQRSSDGISTQGVSQFHARGFLEPAADSAAGLLLRIQGQVNFSVTNSRQKIHFRSFATTCVNGSAAIEMDSQGFLSYQNSRMCASTNVANCRASVDMHLGRRIVGRIADRAIARKTPEIENSLTREVTQKVQSEIDKQIAEALGKANQYLRDEAWRRAKHFDIAPRTILTRSTPDELRFLVYQDTQSGLAAPNPCPPPKRNGPCIAVHSSMLTTFVNNYLYFQLTKRAASVDASMMQGLALAANENPSLRQILRFPGDQVFMAPAKPILKSLEFDLPNAFRVVIHPDRIGIIVRAKLVELSDGRKYSNYQLQLYYQFVPATNYSGARFELLKGADDKPLMELVRYDSHPIDSFEHSLLHRVLTNEIAMAFPIGIALPTNASLTKVGNMSLQLTSIELDNGWLTAYISPVK